MLDDLLKSLKADPEFLARVTAWRTEAPRAERLGEWPEGLDRRLVDLLARRGIARPWVHQAAAARSAMLGRDTVLVTPTASGKSLGYNLPVLSSMLEAPADSRPAALYLFPTKALSQDQVAGLNSLLDGLGEVEGGQRPLGTWTYDGDTPGDLRRILRDSGDLVVTNPYMLHVGILPNHLRWGPFLRRLEWLVIDELHVYTGIFGSSVANVLRRLLRIAAHYGSHPTILAASATVRDPVGHFARLTEREPVLVDRNGSPSGARHHVFVNPPLLEPALGLRGRAVDEARDLARRLLEADVSTIVFGPSRTGVEVLVKYLKDAAFELGKDPESVVGYRGGYLPLLRRRIEEGLREGTIRVVVATNALELGVDIGSLDAVVMTGYPGTVASYRQQSGRAGRRSSTAVSFLVGSSKPLDQYVLAHPSHVLEGVGETPPADPDNLVIATRHMQCAAFELPFRRGDPFGDFPETAELLQILSGPGGALLERDGRYHWMDERYPADEVSLDAVEMDTFLVMEEGQHPEPEGDRGRVRIASLGHVDRARALTTIHPEAIYQHQGAQYQITALDWEGRRAYAKRVQVDYYTEAETETDVQVLTEDAREEHRAGAGSGGERGAAGRGVPVRPPGSAEGSDGPPATVLLGHGEVHVTTMATIYKRIRFYTNENLETGPIDLPAEEVDTTAFWIVLGPDVERQARFEESTRSGAVAGLAWLLRGVAPLFVSLGKGAVAGRGFACHPHFDRPTIMLWDDVPGGVGLAERLFEARRELLVAASERLRQCACPGGCPACIGLGGNRGRPAKAAARVVLDLLLDQEGGRLAFEGATA